MKQLKITRENPIITYCHLLAALMVFTGHWYALLGKEYLAIGGKPIQGWGVRILFLISGFLSWNSISQKETVDWKFIVKKLKRIFPPLWLCLLVTSFFLFFISENKSEYFISALKYIISNAVLIPRHKLAGVFENNPYPVAVNGSLWTLPVEMACFVSVPILFYLFVKISALIKNDRLGEIVRCAATAVICIVIQVILTSGIIDRFPSVSFIAGSALKVMLWFYLGILVYMISSQRIIRIVGCAGLVAFLVVPFAREFLYPYIVGCIFAELVYWGNTEYAQKLPKMINICYGVFLYGFPLEQAIVYLFKVKNATGISNIVLFAVALVVDVLLASGSYYLIERKSIGKGK